MRRWVLVCFITKLANGLLREVPGYCSHGYPDVSNPANGHWKFSGNSAPKNGVIGANFQRKVSVDDATDELYINGKKPKKINTHTKCYTLMESRKANGGSSGTSLGGSQIKALLQFYADCPLGYIMVTTGGGETKKYNMKGVEQPSYTYNELKAWNDYVKKKTNSSAGTGPTFGWSGPNKSAAGDTATLGQRQVQAAIFFSKRLTESQHLEVANQMIMVCS